jgi:hypothetical protein
MSTHGHLMQVRDVHALVDAISRLRTLGYTHLEAFTPYPVDELADWLRPAPPRIAPAMLAGGIVGGVGMLLLQYLSFTAGYPINSGGRPDASWPAFVPNAVEVCMLCAVVAGLAAFLLGARLPQLYRAEFNVAWFDEASRDGFLLLLRSDDPRWHPHDSVRDMAALDPLRHAEVPS